MAYIETITVGGVTYDIHDPNAGGGLPVALSKASVEVVRGYSTTVIAKVSSAGAISVTSSDTSVATVSISNGEITITGVEVGEAVVTVSVAASGSNGSGSAAIYVKCYSLNLVSWASGSDSDIANMLAAHYEGIIDVHDYWSVGDIRRVSLSAMAATGVGESHSAQSVDLVLMNSGGKTLATAINSIRECAFIVGQKDSLATAGYMNATDYNSGGWALSLRRKWCNNVYKNAMPSTLVDIFKPFINITAKSGTDGTIINSTDTFALPAVKEVFGITSCSRSEEADALSQFEWYQTSANRIKKMGISGSAGWWRERSPESGDSARFCAVASSGDSGVSSASGSVGLSPFGCI